MIYIRTGFIDIHSVSLITQDSIENNHNFKYEFVGEEWTDLGVDNFLEYKYEPSPNTFYCDQTDHI